MNTSFEFETEEEFINFSENARDRICSCILFSIQQALCDNEKETVLFDVNVKGNDNVYEISLHKDEWKTALTTCIEIFTENNMPDEAIDSYLLKEELYSKVDS